MYTYIWYTYTYIYACIHAFMHMHSYAHLSVSLSLYIYIYIRLSIYIYIYISIYIYIYIRIHMCMSVRYAYSCLHVSMHTWRARPFWHFSWLAIHSRAAKNCWDSSPWWRRSITRAGLLSCETAKLSTDAISFRKCFY